MRTEEERIAVRRRRTAHLDRRWQSRSLVNTFIVWHLLAVTFWLMPAQSSLRSSAVGLFNGYMVSTGLMQGWGVFSPNPDNRDLYVDAEVRRTDGSTVHWTYPRMITLDYLTRYREERYRKLIETAHLDINSELWPSLAIFAAKHVDRPNLHPVQVTLYRHYRFVPPPGERMPPFQLVSFYTKTITARDLR